MLVSWNWIKEYLGETPLSGAQAAELLGVHSFELEGVTEAGDDCIIDVDITPNRSSDCLCQRGVARELASITGTPLAHDPLRNPPALQPADGISVSIEDPQACPRFSASLITGVQVGESPDWLKERLQAIGQRPINNIVDATNYVMFAIGQPLHAYDADLFPQVDGAWQFQIRRALAGETVSLIPEGGKEEDRIVTCEGTELLIVDGSSNTPIGLAGVKGGRFAGVHAGTTNILIEAAHFHPILTRKTARRLNIVIDASKRFENEPSRELIPYAQSEIVALITDIAGGAYQGTVDIYLESVPTKTVTLQPAHVCALLGITISASEMKHILERIGATVTEESGALLVSAPWERTDLSLPEDYIEEIGRLHGYHHIPAILPTPRPLPELNRRHFYSELIRTCLIEHGFTEVITSSFRKKDQVELKNALASDKRFLRSSLQPNLDEVLEANAHFTDLLGTDDTRVFEIGTVFAPGEHTICEHISLAVGVRLKVAGYSGKEDALLAPALAAVAEMLGLSLNWKIHKGVAEVNLSEILHDLPAPTAYVPVAVGAEVAYQPFSVYPHTSRDIALWVTAGTEAAAVEAVMRASAGPLCVRITCFDEFTKEGRTSYAFRLVFQSSEKTLTGDEVDGAMDAVYAAVASEGWEVR